MEKFGSAQYLARVEDQRLLTGKGGFTDNLDLPNQAHLAFVRSPHARARLVSIDVSAAREAPGVIAVYIWTDMEQDGAQSLSFPAMFKTEAGENQSADLEYTIEQ